MKKTAIVFFMIVFLFAAFIQSGAASSQDSAAISTTDDFYGMNSDGSYYLTGDIILSRSYPGEFTGTLNGNGHTVTLTGEAAFFCLSGNISNLIIDGFVGTSAVSYDGNAGSAAYTTAGNAEFDGVCSYADVYATGSAGGIVGSVGGMSRVTFKNCANYGSVSGFALSGGIAGYTADGIVCADGCINYGAVTSSDGCAGGIFASCENRIIYVKNCINDKNAVIRAAGNYAAGIVADMSGGYIAADGCVNYAAVTTEGMSAGGIIGKCSGGLYATDCLNYGNITSEYPGFAAAGGIVGAHEGIPGASRINYCENYGSVCCPLGTGNTRGAGGICGFFMSADGNSISGSFNAGCVSSANIAAGICAYTSGGDTDISLNCNCGDIIAPCAYQTVICGTDGDGVRNNFYASYINAAAYACIYENSYFSQSPDGFAFTESELYRGALATRLNTCAAGGTYSDMAEYHGILFQEIGGLPSPDSTRGAVYSTGEGYTNTTPDTVGSTLSASDTGEYIAAVALINSLPRFTGCLEITADIDLTGLSVRLNNFCGTLDGNGHALTVDSPLINELCGTVSDLTLCGSIKAEASEDCGALAVRMTSGALITNVINQASLTGDTGSVCGGFAGRSCGFVRFCDCLNSGAVCGEYAGGFTGISSGGLYMTGCANSSAGTVSGTTAGGLCGTGSECCVMTDCVCTGNVTASLTAGGLAGSLGGYTLIYDCITGTENAAQDVSVSANDTAGGIVGELYGDIGMTSGAVLIGCRNYSGVLSYAGIAGGIAGNITLPVTVKDAVNGGVVNAPAGIAGGIAGSADNGVHHFFRCVNSPDGTITAQKHCGGIAGKISGTKITGASSQFVIEFCYNYGKIKSTSGYAGGIAGYGGATKYVGTENFQSCGNYGDVSADTYAAGGILGYGFSADGVSSPSLEYCFNIECSITGAKYACALLGYCNSSYACVQGCFSAGSSLYGGVSALTLCNGKTSANVYGNWYSDEYSGCLAYQGKASAPLPDGYSFTAEDAKSGLLAYRMNEAAGAELFYQNTEATTPDRYPTTDNEHNVVRKSGITVNGEVRYGSRVPEPVTLTGASVRMASSCGLRFTSRVSAADIEYANSVCDAGTVPSYGTLIIPTDYLEKYGVTEYTINGLEAAGFDEYDYSDKSRNTNAAGLYYINITASEGVSYDDSGDIYINAALVDLKPSSYNREFSAAVYIRFTCDGKDYYVFSGYDPADNSRSIAQIAQAALGDIVLTRDTVSGYLYQLDNGRWSCYSADERAILSTYLTCFKLTLAVADGYELTFTGSTDINAVGHGESVTFKVSGLSPIVYCGKEEILPENGAYTIIVTDNITLTVSGS